jgi:high-affinity Fe2+/Pb2+ permease
MFEPSLPRPVSDIPEEQEWTLPFHPLIRVPLALLLMGLMYWVLVIHQMQLPGHWLVATTIVTIINLWSWREPLVLVALVAVGVLLMTIVGWIINHLPIEAAIAVLVLIPVLVLIAVHELRKRKLRSRA